MSYVSTFGSFTQARLAIYASQAGITVTGNNIANINTDGYTRQRLDQTSFYAGSSDRYSSELSLRIGYGTLATGVSQLRDPYLDIRYRNETTNVGYNDTKLSVLEQIEDVLDEIGDGDEDFGVIADQLNDLYKMLSQLSDQTGQDEYDILVRTSAETLTNLLRSYSSQLDKIYNNTVSSFNTGVDSVNTILTQIQGLNESIRKAEIYGDKALELRDERNLLLDELSSYIGIDVTYEYESIGAGVEVEKLIVEIADSDTRLVDGIYVRQLEAIMVPQANPDYDDEDPASLPYLDAKGNPVANEEDANIVNNDGFDITLTALADSKGRLQYTTEAVTTATYDSLTALYAAYGGTYDAATSTSPITRLNADGTTTIVTYSEKTTSVAKTDQDGNPVLDNDGNQIYEDVTTYIAQVYTRTPSGEVELGDNDTVGALQALREMLTEEGEFASAADIERDPDAATKRGIPYYQQLLDLFAYQLAETFNKANQGYVYSAPDENGNSYYVDESGDRLLLAGADINTDVTKLTEDQKTELLATYGDKNATATDEEYRDYLNQYLKDNDGYYLGAVLFSNNGDGDDTTGINASNISVSKTWANTPSIVRSFEYLPNVGIGSTDSSNVLHIQAMMNADQKYNPQNVGDGDAAGNTLFTGSFSEFWNNIGITLGKEMDTTSTLLDTHYATAVVLSSSRDSVSAVDLNDEAMNLSMYQQAYNAACRLMTTLDSVLDKLVNNTGVTV